MGKRKSQPVSWRDTLAYMLCNFILNTIATPEYNAMITVMISRGRESLDQTVAQWAKEKNQQND